MFIKYLSQIFILWSVHASYCIRTVTEKNDFFSGFFFSIRKTKTNFEARFLGIRVCFKRLSVVKSLVSLNFVYEGTCVSQYLLTGSYAVYAAFLVRRSVRCRVGWVFVCVFLRVRCDFLRVPTAPLAFLTSAEAAMSTSPIKQRFNRSSANLHRAECYSCAHRIRAGLPSICHTL